MDGAEAGRPGRTRFATAMQLCVGGRGNSCEACGASLGETAPSADLGGSSKYSSGIFEDRSGEGFRVNSDWTWVSRS